jgi:putative transposase
MDDLPIYNVKKETSYKFSGKRIYRGLYKSKNNTLINADINGASNIIRKALPNAFINVKDFGYLLSVNKISIN